MGVYMNGKGKKKTKKDPLEVKQPNGNTRPSTNKKSAPFHVSERAFFSGRAFFMSMLVGFFVVVVLQQPPHNSSDSGCLFSTDPKTDIRTDNRGKNQTCNHVIDSNLHCPVSTIMHWDKSAALWFGILSRCDIYHLFIYVFIYFALQKSWSQSNRCLSRSGSYVWATPDGRCGVRWTGVSPSFQCLDFSSALNSRPSRHHRLHCVSHKELSRQPGVGPH